METYAECRDSGKKDSLKSVLSSIYKIHKRNIIMCLLTSVFAEMLAIYCCYNIGYLTEFMHSKEKPSQYEISFLFMFSLAFLCQIFLRNLHYFYNAMLSLKLKKLFMSSLYRKLSRLSLDSMSEISDGKLISLL